LRDIVSPKWTKDTVAFDFDGVDSKGPMMSAKSVDALTRDLHGQLIVCILWL